MIEQLFFQLIRVAIGTQDLLTQPPSAKEWQRLYDMAKKQSLVGISFAGVQKLVDSEKEDYCGMSELQYLRWMGMAAKIQQRNEFVNRQCVELQQMLANDGFRSCLLKGQGNAKLYPEHLNSLRQSGDIDVWLDAPKEKIVEWARAHGGKDLTGDLHVECEMFTDTAVELHFTPSIASGRKTNKRLQEWFEGQKPKCFYSNDNPLNQPQALNHLNHSNYSNLLIKTPPVEFNLVYLLHHIFRHYLYEGVGLRQVMDYYFVLQAYYEERRTKNEGRKTVFRDSFVNNSSLVEDDSLRLIKRLGMEKFAGALMYLMREVFGMDEKYMICPVDEKRGRRLLEVVMEGGNFGHSTEKYKITGWDKPWNRLSRYVRRNWYMLWDYPEEILSNVLGKIKL